MLLLVVALATPPAVWAWRVLGDEARFAAVVAPLARHPLTRRAIRRRVPAVMEPLVDHLLASPSADRVWRYASIAAHRRARRPTRRIALVAVAAVAALGTSHGRWRSLAWIVATVTVATTVHAI